ncbi:DNA polymerase III [Candidatus Aerophobetes bacterium Ae_b3b]|nr:MAG: DNA polymerase III [Candidatus Aerophobetes bacterium Ae_b3b]
MARKLDRVYIVDIEATCWKEKRPDGQISEIIQVGIVEFDLPSGSISSKVSHNIRPQYSKVSEFCTELTGISAGELEGEKNFSEFLDMTKERFPHLKNYTWASYGDYDRKHLKEMSDLHKRPYLFGRTHINIKNLFALKWGLKKEVGMRKALRILNKELVGQHHNALDDALNITEIFKACLQKGVIIEKADGSKIFHCIY